MCLCYEVWCDGAMVGAYWDVQVAWRVSEAIVKTNPKSDVSVIVANGNQFDCTTGVRSKRSDVIGD